MKKALLLFFSILLFCGLTRLPAQTNSTTVADGSATSTYLPIWGLYMSSWMHTQMIYPESMLADLVGGTISEISFYTSAPAFNYDWLAPVRIRMGITQSNSYTTADYLTDSMSTVYIGTISVVMGTMNIVFDTAFTYSGGNLLLDIATEVKTPNYKGATFKGVNTDSYMSIRGHNATGLENIINQIRHAFTPMTTFTYTGGVSCLSPSAVTASNVSEYDATVVITPRSGQSAWEYLLVPDGSDTTGWVWTPTTDTILQFSNLTDNTPYTVYVRTVCDSSTSASAYANFRTLCAPISQVPVLWDFETNNVEYSTSYPMPACWKRLPETAQAPYVYNYIASHALSGSHLLYFTSQGAANLAILPEIDTTILPINNLQLSFYAKTFTYGTSMDLIVGVIEDPTDNSTFQPYDTIHVNSGSYGSEPILIMFNNFVGFGNHFAIKADNPSTTLMYVCVDDLLLEEIPECPKVQHLEVTSLSESSIGLSWDGMNDGYVARYQVEGDTVWTYQTTTTDSIEISGLSSNTTYIIEVAPDCDEITEDMYRPITVLTNCSSTNAPYFIDFETESMMHCWTIAQQGVIEDSYYGNMLFPALEASSSNAYSGTRYLEIGAQAGYSAVLVAPKMNQNIEDLRIKFYTREPQSFLSANVLGTLQVGVMTGAMDIASFVPVATVPVSGTTYSLHTVDFSQAGVTGDGYYIAFRYIGAGSDTDNVSGIFMDDITITIITSCPEPTSLNVVSVTPTTAELSWNGTATDYNVYYRRADELDFGFMPATLTGGTFTLTGLESSTHYYWYVSAICADSTEAPSAISTFMTECGIYTVFPHHEDFNSYGSNTLPDCWLKINGATETSYTLPMTFMNTTTFQYAHSLPTCMVFGSSATNSGTAIMPPFSQNLQGLRVSFYARPENSSSGVMHVGYITDPADSSTFVSVSQIATSNLSDNAYHQYLVDFSNYTIPDSARIAFRYVCSNEWFFLLDDITVSIIPNCFAPLQLTATNITSTTADLTWLSNIDTLELYYKNSSETNWNVEVASLDSTGYFHLTGLTPSKTYTWYVVALCDDNIYTSATSTFTTDCAGITSVPRTWTFETGNSGGTSSYPLPPCWHRTDSQFPYAYHSSLYNYAHTGDRCLFFNTTNGNLYATIPAIDTTELLLDTLQLKFFARTYNTSQSYILDVGVMTDPMDPNTFELVQSYNLTSGIYPQVAFRTNFTNYTGHGAFIAFRCLAASTANAYVDDVTLQRKPDCEPIGDLTITSITTNSVTLTWTESEDINTFLVEYMAEGGTTWSTDTVNAMTATVTGLSSGTNYTIRVKPLCDDPVDYLSVSCHTQCEAVTSFPYYESFEDGAFGCWSPEFIVQNGSSWQNHTLNTMAQYPADGARYVYYHPSAINSYSEGLLVSPVFDFSNTQYPYIAFFYDALGEGSNLDTLSLFYRTSATDSWHYLDGWGCHDALDITWHTDTVALPSPTSTYQVAFKAVSYHGNGIFLDNFTVLNIVPPVIQPTVVTYDATNVTSFSAELNGAITDQGNQTISNSGFEWKVSGPGSYQMVSVSGTTLNHTLTSLNPNTSYSYRAFATTADGPVYGELKSFTTMELSGDTCQTPTNLHQVIPETEIEAGVIIVTWTDNAGVSQWNLQYRKADELWTSTVVSGEPTYSITNLIPGTEYEIQVQAVCETSLSEWSSSLTATASDDIGIADHLADCIHLYPNPAKDYVDVILDGNVLDVQNVEVYDVYGKLVNTLDETDLPTRINVSGLASGMYFVRLRTTAGTATKTFVKQ